MAEGTPGVPLEQRLLELWTHPPDSCDDPVAAFRGLYTDPVTINGTAVGVVELVERARSLHLRSAITPSSWSTESRPRASWRSPSSTRPDTPAPGRRRSVQIRRPIESSSGWESTYSPSTGAAGSGAIWVLGDELQRIVQLRATH
jgi:hypothetical protein